MYNAIAIPKPKYRSKIQKISTYQLNLLLLVGLLISGISYIILVNSLSTKGYEIGQLEQKIKTLETQNKNLEMQSSNLQSVNRVRLYAKELNFVPVDQTVFIKESDFALR